MSKNNKNHKKQNKPYYINENFINGEQKKNNDNNNNKSVVIKKFKLGIDKNKNPLVTIDNTLHFMNSNQFHAFTLGCINISKKINPEVDYTKILTKVD